MSSYGTTASYPSFAASRAAALNASAADTSAPSLIYAASGMPSTDPAASPKTSTPIVTAAASHHQHHHQPTARELFMMGKPVPTGSSSKPAVVVRDGGEGSGDGGKAAASDGGNNNKCAAPPPAADTTISNNLRSSSTSHINNKPAAVSAVRTTTTTTVTVASKTPVASTAAVTHSSHQSSATTTTTTATTASRTSSASVLPAAGKFFPPLTVDTSVAGGGASSSSPLSTPSPASSLSPCTSAIIRGASYPVYQVAATSRIQSSTTATTTISTTSSQSGGAGVATATTPPGTVLVTSSQRVQFSERLHSSSMVNSPDGSPAASPSSPSSSAGEQIADSSTVKKPSVDTSAPSVSSAISVLMSSTAASTTVSTTAPSAAGASKAYRYAPRSVIANTYMSKLGSSALDQYRKNMSQIYQAPYVPPADNQPRSPVKADPAPPSSPTKPAQSASPGPKDSSGAHSPNEQQPHVNGPSAISKDSERLRYRPNAPRPLRRRLSTGDSPPDRPHPVRADIIRVHDVINNNSGSAFPTETTSFSTNIPYADDSSSSSPQQHYSPGKMTSTAIPVTHVPKPLLRKKKPNLRSQESNRTGSKRRVSFDPLALLLDASLEGETELVKQCAEQVTDPSQANDEGITALHNAICAGHFEIVKFLVEFGCNVNAPDSDGWTPLHCAASCNNLPMVKLLVEHGACIFATTISDRETAAEKCEEDEDGYDGCSDYLYSIQEKLGIINAGVAYAVFDYARENNDELSFSNMDAITILRKGDDREKEWWWARKVNSEGYVPRNLLGMYPRVALKSKKDGNRSESK